MGKTSVLWVSCWEVDIVFPSHICSLLFELVSTVKGVNPSSVVELSVVTYIRSKPIETNQVFIAFTSYGTFISGLAACRVFRCVLVSLYEGVSVRPSVGPSVRLSAGL